MPKSPILAIGGSEDGPGDAPPDLLERLTDGTPAHPDRRARETPVGDDDRTPVPDPTAIPYRRICQISYKTPRPDSSRLTPRRGTGWLIGPRLLLTAGHVILDIVNRGEPENLSVEFAIAPGRTGKGSDEDAVPYGLFGAARLSAHPRWLSECDQDYDIGCIHLDRPVPGRVGHWGFAAFDDTALVGAEVNIAGYPVLGPPEDGSGNPFPIPHKGMKAFWHRNRIRRVTPHRLYYDVDTSGGQSGAPVWFRLSAQEPPVAIGIHAYGFDPNGADENHVNSATRITPQLLQTIRRWIREDEDSADAPAAAPVSAPTPGPKPDRGTQAAAESGRAAAVHEFRRFLKTTTGEESAALIGTAESGDLGPDAATFAMTALTAAAEACEAMIARLLRRCRVQQRLDLWSSILTLVLGSSLFAASRTDGNAWTVWLGIATVIAAVISLIAKRMGGGEGGLMAKYVDLHGVAADARLHSDVIRHKLRAGIDIADEDLEKALSTTRRLTKEKGWMQASDFLFPDGGIAMALLGDRGEDGKKG